ncbi:MAG: VOC family protein [Planctomycetota bacterium]
MPAGYKWGLEVEDMGDAGVFREFHAAIIPVSDMIASRRWYEQVLELKPVKVSPTGMLTVYGTGGSSHLCIYTPEPGVERPGYHGSGSFPNLRAEDAAATHVLLTERGVRCTEMGMRRPVP